MTIEQPVFGPINQEAPAVVVDAQLRWIQPPNGDRVELQRRPVLRRIVSRLVSARRNTPGKALPTRTLIEAGWPGDRSKPRALENRLWVALSTLRKLGLNETILRNESGYFIPTALAITETGHHISSRGAA